jgi:hypothetical protein
MAPVGVEALSQGWSLRHPGRRWKWPHPPVVAPTWKRGIIVFALLKDTATEVQLLIRNEHVSAVEIRKDDQSLIVYLQGGQVLHLTHDQSKQYLSHIKNNMHAVP